VPSFHCQIKKFSRGKGQSAIAASAYRCGGLIRCDREDRMHDYRRRRGVRFTKIIAPSSSPAWARDRSKLWNNAEAVETRKNSCVAREFEIALPSEVNEDARQELALEFASALVERYGFAIDVAIHDPSTEGDERNHHAHLLATTRTLDRDGFGAKTRVLDDRKQGSIETTEIRALWANHQNRVLEQAGVVDRVTHLSLADQRAAAVERSVALETKLRSEPEPSIDDKRGIAVRARLEEALVQDTLRCETLNREPEIKIGPGASAQERRAQRLAKGKRVEAQTDRGAAVQRIRNERSQRREILSQLIEWQRAYFALKETGRTRLDALLNALHEFRDWLRGSREIDAAVLPLELRGAERLVRAQWPSIQSLSKEERHEVFPLCRSDARRAIMQLSTSLSVQEQRDYTDIIVARVAIPSWDVGAEPEAMSDTVAASNAEVQQRPQRKPSAPHSGHRPGSFEP